jgi:Domain of unknown function (DUF222)
MAALEVQKSPETRVVQAAVAQMRAGVQAMSALVRQADTETLRAALIQIRETGIDPLEAVFAAGVRRFDKSGEYHTDGALSIIEWLRASCKLSGGAAAERVGIARQLEKLPQTEAAFATGRLGYQHVVVMARAAEHVGAAAVRKEEASLLVAAQTMDPGCFTTVAKNFEHRVDAAAALGEANRAYQRRYFHIGDPVDGLVRLGGLLDAEGGATLRAALQPFMKPISDDERTYGQRSADALVELGRHGSSQKRDGSGPRPQLIIRAGLDTLAGTRGASAGELDGGGTVPAETVQRYACDSAISRIIGQGELDNELSHATRTIPAPTRRALESRDRHCVFKGCGRQPSWCDGHHLVWWTRGGATTLPNLALLCRPHHRMVHEEGWRLERHQDGRFRAIPPPRRVAASARSARGSSPQPASPARVDRWSPYARRE